MYNQQELENRREAARMVQALTKALVQPLQMEAAPQPLTQLQLVLVLEEKEVQKKEVVEQGLEKKGE